MTENIKIGYCSTCKWRYELQFSIGCGNPVIERPTHEYFGDCKLWQPKEEV